MNGESELGRSASSYRLSARAIGVERFTSDVDAGDDEPTSTPKGTSPHDASKSSRTTGRGPVQYLMEAGLTDDAVRPEDDGPNVDHRNSRSPGGIEDEHCAHDGRCRRSRPKTIVKLACWVSDLPVGLPVVDLVVMALSSGIRGLG